MKSLSMVAALLLSAGTANAGVAMPLPSMVAASVPLIPVGATCVDTSNSKNWRPITGECSTVIVQPRDNKRRNNNQVRRENWRADCHRDVRAHRINGVVILHRHVGDNCQIREVN